MDKIIDGLYLGDIRAAANLFLLKQNVRLVSFHSNLGYYSRASSISGS